ncbi:MAG TPA: YggT family protein [Gemmatimonadales bacterium]
MGGALAVAATHWAVRARHLNPSGWWPRFIRGWSDPLLRPFERGLLVRGGNPQDATIWLVGAVVLAGLLAVLAVRWLLGWVVFLQRMGSAGLGDWIRLLISAATSLLMAAIVVRVVGSWLGVGRFTKWMRPFYTLTDWLLLPIRRRLPATGPLDLSPFVGYLLLLVVRELLLSIIR